MKKILLLLILVVSLLAKENESIYKTSYDCENTTLNKTEYTICKNQILAEWDLFLYRTYKYAYTIEKDNKTLKHSQIIWMKKRNKCKTDKRCIENSYTDRIQTLIDTYVKQQTVPENYIYTILKKYPIKDCSKIKRYTTVSKEMIAGNRASAVHKDIFDVYKTDRAIKECEYIKENIWNQIAFKNIKIIQPIIKAKFFKDKKYQEFLKESINKAPNLKVALKYGTYRCDGGTGNFWYPECQQEIKDLLEKDELWTARYQAGSFGSRLAFNICDIRVYKGEFDGNQSDGEETMVFSGLTTDPKKGFYLKDSYMKIYNFQEKKIKFTPFYEPKTDGRLKNTLLSTTSTCLDYDVPFEGKKRVYKPIYQNIFLVYQKAFKTIVISVSEWESGGVTIELYDFKKNRFIQLTTDKKGEAR